MDEARIEGLWLVTGPLVQGDYRGLEGGDKRKKQFVWPSGAKAEGEGDPCGVMYYYLHSLAVTAVTVGISLFVSCLFCI